MDSELQQMKTPQLSTGELDTSYDRGHTCQLLRIFRKLYGFFVPLRAYGRRGISLRIFLFTKSFIFLSLTCSFCSKLSN